MQENKVTKVGSRSLCAHRFCHFWSNPLLSSCFKMASDWGEGVTMFSSKYFGYSRCERKTILCRYPGTGFWAASVGSLLESHLGHFKTESLWGARWGVGGCVLLPTKICSRVCIGSFCRFTAVSLHGFRKSAKESPTNHLWS